MHSFVECERCDSGEKARYVVHSDLMHVRVCVACAEVARKLGLTVTPMHARRHRHAA